MLSLLQASLKQIHIRLTVSGSPESLITVLRSYAATPEYPSSPLREYMYLIA